MGGKLWVIEGGTLWEPVDDSSLWRGDGAGSVCSATESPLHSVSSPSVTRIGMATATSASPAMSPDAAGIEYCA